jgi:hypothetical protein
MTKYTKKDMYNICKLFFIVIMIIISICIIKKLFNNIEGMNNNEFVAYKLGKGREVSKKDFRNGKWPWNNNRNNNNNNVSGTCPESDPDFIENITAATNRWIDLVTNDNLIGEDMSDENRIKMIGNLFCLNKLNGESCSTGGIDDFCASLFGTVSNQLRRGRENIENYFEYFANVPGLSARSINDPIFNIQKLSNDVYLNSALITWTWDDGPGSDGMDPLIARMSFIYKYQEKPLELNEINYCIVQLHSSAMPDRADGIPPYLENIDSSEEYWMGETQMYDDLMSDYFS